MIIIWKLIKSTSIELKIVLATLAILLLLPLFAVVVLANAGIQIVSDALVAINPTTRQIEIYDPNGNRVAELTLATTWPTRGYISDEFGSNDSWRLSLGFGAHDGIDIANRYGKTGEPVTTFTTGTIIYTKNQDSGACGKSFQISHGYHIVSTYCHMDSVKQLEKGTPVEPGDIIGYMGETGLATGPHTHFMISIYGIAVNPRTFVSGQPQASTP